MTTQPTPNAPQTPVPTAPNKPAPQAQAPETQAPETWSARLPLTIGFAGLFTLVIGFGSWASLSNISGAIIASGQIEVDQNRQVVQHPDGGVVAEILVEEGDTVALGAPLLRLDSDRLQSELAIAEGQLFELMARRGRLSAERDETNNIAFDPALVAAAAKNPDIRGLMDGQSRLHVARQDTAARETEQLGKRHGQIANQVDGIVAQTTALETQLALIGEELVNQKDLLAKGLAQATRVLSLQREQARLSGQLGELAAQKAQAQGRMTEIDIEVIKIGTSRREAAITTLRDLQYRELELSEQTRATRDRLSRLEITAPVSGIVYGMQVFTPRSVIRSADPLLFLIPQDRPLVIAAQIAITDIDKIYVGQNVNLRFSALDQRETPELLGQVMKISPDAFQDDATGLTYYRAEIMLLDGEQDRLPDGTTLLPGMPVEAYIRTEDRTPIAYLTKPFTDYFVKAFRE